MGRDPGDAQTGTELIADLIRERDGLTGRHDRELRGSAESPVRLGAIHPDALADATTLDTIADSVDDASAVAMGNHARVRHAIPHPVAPLLRVARVDGRERHADPDLPPPRNRVGHLADLQHLSRAPRPLIP